MKVRVRRRRRMVIIIVIAVMPDTVRLMVVFTVHLTLVTRPSKIEAAE